MELSKIKELVTAAFQAGRMDAQTEIGLRADKVRRRVAESFLVSKGFKKCLLDKWVMENLVKEYVGDSKNSPRLYSMNELNAMVLSVQLKKLNIGVN